MINKEYFISVSVHIQEQVMVWGKKGDRLGARSKLMKLGDCLGDSTCKCVGDGLGDRIFRCSLVVRHEKEALSTIDRTSSPSTELKGDGLGEASGLKLSDGLGAQTERPHWSTKGDGLGDRPSLAIGDGLGFGFSKNDRSKIGDCLGEDHLKVMFEDCVQSHLCLQ